MGIFIFLKFLNFIFISCIQTSYFDVVIDIVDTFYVGGYSRNTDTCGIFSVLSIISLNEGF